MKSLARMLFGAAALMTVSTVSPVDAGDIRFTGDTGPQEREALANLLDEFNAWIKQNSPYKTAAGPVEQIVFVKRGSLVMAGDREVWMRGKIRATYDGDRKIIYITRPWSASKPYDQSVLLHELIHHAQADAKHWYCPQAMEWDAYKLQDVWLRKHDIDAGFYWAGILLESSCVTRDFHPD